MQPVRAPGLQLRLLCQEQAWTWPVSGPVHRTCPLPFHPLCPEGSLCWAWAWARAEPAPGGSASQPYRQDSRPWTQGQDKNQRPNPELRTAACPARQATCDTPESCPPGPTHARKNAQSSSPSTVRAALRSRLAPYPWPLLPDGEMGTCGPGYCRRRTGPCAFGPRIPSTSCSWPRRYGCDDCNGAIATRPRLSWGAGQSRGYIPTLFVNNVKS